MSAAAYIAEDLDFLQPRSKPPHPSSNAGSLRCAAQVLGVLFDALPWWLRYAETELNGASGSPLLEPASGDLLQGGNFYGGHMAFVAESMKLCLAQVVDLMDRQLALLMSPHRSRGLPRHLVGAGADAATLQHGFQSLQVTATALTCEALKQATPVTLFGRSTDDDFQDKLCLGSLAARDVFTMLHLVERVAAIYTLAVVQAADLRALDNCHLRLLALHATVRRFSAPHDTDRPMSSEIETVVQAYLRGELPIGEIHLEALKSMPSTVRF